MCKKFISIEAQLNFIIIYVSCVMCILWYFLCVCIFYRPRFYAHDSAIWSIKLILTTIIIKILAQNVHWKSLVEAITWHHNSTVYNITRLQVCFFLSRLRLYIALH